MYQLLPQKYTTGQLAAWKKLQQFKNSSDRFLVIVGYAGTGKTTLITDYLKANDPFEKVVLCAPTHKALKILRDKSARKNNHTTKTIHSLLRLKPVTDYKTGEQKFIPDRSSQGGIPKGTELVIVDEASMIGRDLWDYIVEASRDNPRIQFVFVGDPAQLPPVKEADSPVFKIENQILLTEVVRHGDVLLDNATALRQGIEDVKASKSPSCQFLKKQPVEVYGNYLKWYSELREAIVSSRAFQDADYVRSLAWTNNRRKSLNSMIREWRFGKNVPPFLPGERLVVINTLVRRVDGREQIYAYTCDEFTLEKITSAKLEYGPIALAPLKPGKNPKPLVPKLLSYNFWLLETIEGKVLRVVHNKDKSRFTTHLRQLKQMALKESDEKERRRLWKEYYEMQQFTDDVDYAYCLTVHKSQGSTFENVFVDANDICRNQNLLERLQCLYVAATRPSQRLAILHNGDKLSAI